MTLQRVSGLAMGRTVVKVMVLRMAGRSLRALPAAERGAARRCLTLFCGCCCVVLVPVIIAYTCTLAAYHVLALRLLITY